MKIENFQEFYSSLLYNVSYSFYEFIFNLKILKKLPSEFSDYPYKVNDISFEIAKDSCLVLKKMRKGGIFLTAHYGNYESIGPWLCCLKIPLVASYLPIKPKWLNAILEKEIRSINGYNYSIHPKNPRDFISVINKGNLFCLLADQDSRVSSAKEGVFLEQRVNVNPLPEFLLKYNPNCPVYICWLESTLKKHILHAIEIDSNLVNNTFNKWLESRIIENPQLWFGFTHRRFFSKNPEIYLKE